MKMKRIEHVLVFLLLTLAVHAQRGYECWIDDDYASRTNGTQASDDNVSLSVDISSLSPGLHFFNYHAQDVTGGWGTLNRSPFVKNIASCNFEYWIDEDYTKRKVISQTDDNVALSFNLDEMPAGIHSLNIRPRTNDGTEGPATYMLFVNELKVTAYEYWFDDDTAHKVVADASGNELSLPISVSHLSGDAHYLNFRAKHVDGTWGTVMRKGFVLKSNITGYQYGFSGDVAHRVDVEPTDQLVMDKQSFNIPEPKNKVAICDTTTFMIDTANNTAMVVRRDTTDFSIFFRNDEKRVSDVLTHGVAVADTLVRALPEIALFGRIKTDRADSSDFRGFHINASDSNVYLLSASQDCRLILFDRQNQRMEQSDTVSLSTAHQITLKEGRYYGILYDMQGSSDSTIVSYTLLDNTVAIPIITHVGNKIAINTATNQATIHFTIDGTTPNEYSTVYQDSITVERNCTIKAIAYRENYNPSQVATFVVDWIVIGDAKFDGLVATISGERALDEAFEQTGGRSEATKTIAAIVWDKSTQLTNSDLQGISNPNLLVYVNEASLAPSGVQNVVINGQAREIVLTDATSGNNNFYAPQSFTAERISYTRNFGQTTQVGVSRGWESIALPFSVQTITHEEKGAIAPFGSNASNRHFWLRQLGGNGLQTATSIEANTPYIISMPNSADYTDSYNLAGRVTFSAENAQVPATEVKAAAMADSSIVMMPTMQRVSRSSAVWALNVGEVRGSYLEGSVFERDYREVRPFEAYTVHRQESSQPAPRYVPVLEIGGATGISEMEDVRSRMDDAWFTTDGRKLQGKPTKKGVYINGNRKIVIR